jgi:hypothetical protein
MAPTILTFTLYGVHGGEWLTSRLGRRKEQPYPSDRWLVGPAVQLVAVPTELSRPPPPASALKYS